MLKIDNCTYSKSFLVAKYKTKNIETLTKYVSAEAEKQCRQIERNAALFARKTQRGYNAMRAMNLQNSNCLNWSN